MKKSGTLAARADLWNRIGEEVYVYLADPRCDYRVWDDVPRDLRLVKYSGPVEVIQPFEDKCLALGASLYQGFIPLSATGMDADGDDPMDPDIPGKSKTIGEAWHEEASRHWVRDSVAILIAIVVGAAVFLAVGFSVHRADAETRASGYSAEKPMEAEDLIVDAGKAEVRVLGPGPSFEPVKEEEQQWVPEPDYGYSEPVATGGSRYGNAFQSAGVANIGDQEYTWYSQNVTPGGGLTALNENGRHVDEATGFVMDGDGYIAVASPWGRDPVGTVVDTPYGQGKVYDSNEGDSYDLYTDF